MAVANCCFSVLTSSVKFRCCVSPQRYLATPHHSIASLTCKAVVNNRRRPSSNRDREHKEGGSQKKSPGKLKDERSYLHDDDDGTSGKRNAGKAQSMAFKSFGAQRKDKKEFKLDMKEQQVEPQNLKDAAFLDAVVKVYCTHTEPDYSLPWQKQRQYTSTGSAFMIGNGKLLTNAHCVEYYTQVKLKKRGDDTKYVAKVLARGVDCDIALLSVESEKFWEGAEPLDFGLLPRLQDAVTVVGYPLGGDTISVTKGVVSRIEVTSYAHGSSDLLGIQIDAAINPGNSGGPAFNEQGECIGVAFQVYRSEEVENIGYVIPTTVVSHFLNDYDRNGKYTEFDVDKQCMLFSGFPSLGVLLQKLENPALRACLKVQSNEGVLVRRVEPTSDANRVIKEGDVIVSFDDVHVGCEGTVPFRSNERIAFRYLISDVAELGIIRAGSFMKVQVVLNPRVHLLKLLAKSRYSLARFKGEQIVILSQFEDNYLVVLEKEAASTCSSHILKDYGIPSERSSDLLEPYVDLLEDNQAADQDCGNSPVSNLEIGFDGLLWA
ncbi:unnamed protein product [Dovyalis caffra]|uniref:Uncharacterized protein n=1 Tax=Dovyalis caffra TaxID=77055 RepID=A0AAV1S9V1_9ROSI|nr:unnamed protein product [Dovyalis caffra]